MTILLMPLLDILYTLFTKRNCPPGAFHQEGSCEFSYSVSITDQADPVRYPYSRKTDPEDPEYTMSKHLM